MHFIKDKNLWGIFFLSMATLLYEVVLTSIFSYTVWSNYAFLIVSTALFGFGIAGVFLFLFEKRLLGLGQEVDSRVALLAFLFSLSAIISLKVIIVVPLDVSRFDLFINWIYLIIVFLAILTPFFFAGLAISMLLYAHRKTVNRLYFFDLVGASIGSIALMFLITPLGASGTLLFTAVLGTISALIFLTGKKGWGVRMFLGAFLVVVLFMIPHAEKTFHIYPHKNIRNFINILRTQKDFFSGWSTLSKIDVLGREKNGVIRAQIWINGGQNQSYLAGVGSKGIRRPDWGESINFPYIYLRDRRPKALIIGSSGGTEVVYALSHHSNDVDAVEMDPLICKIVKYKFRKHNRDLFFRPDVHLINDEGRSFVLSTYKKYDIIQMKNNFTPIAIASGAINLSETYLLTVEGFKDYINHLTPDGILALNRWGSVRLCTTLRKAFDELGKRDVWKHVVILTGETWMLNGFYYKNSPFSQKQIKWAEEYAHAKHFKVLFQPNMNESDNLYAKILKSKHPNEFYKYGGFDLEPPTDNRPFFNHFVVMGEKIDITKKLIPSELRHIYNLFAWRPWKNSRAVISKADLPMFSLAIESLIVSAFFIFLPLLLSGKKEREEDYKKWPYLYYFTILGLGFIMIELCLMKQFVLFLGYPAMSISLIIAILLFFTGMGSFISERFRQRKVFSLRIIFLLIFLVSMTLMWSLPHIFQMFLGDPFWVKVIVTILLLIPLGLVMGMPFPLGLLLVHERSKSLVGWVWGINGFATVIGSVLVVIISLYFGFDKVFILASLLYLSGVFIVGKLDKRQE